MRCTKDLLSSLVFLSIDLCLLRQFDEHPYRTIRVIRKPVQPLDRLQNQEMFKRKPFLTASLVGWSSGSTMKATWTQLFNTNPRTGFRNPQTR
ncbi:hypothetical protein F5Y17DRAFT_431461 [Xylariaceae sp. FL0594]|nr:hypothetical protein F5Y17DRAFT_431461 [Xylariaceae sp. FL0594]